MIFSFLLKFLGGGIIQSLITARQNELASANATRRIQIQAELDQLNAETDRRKIAASLQQSEDQYTIMRFGKGVLMLLVGLYWAGRFAAKLFGFDDFGVYIKPLDVEEIQVSTMILAYWFVSSTVRQIVGR